MIMQNHDANFRCTLVWIMSINVFCFVSSKMRLFEQEMNTSMSCKMWLECQQCKKKKMSGWCYDDIRCKYYGQCKWYANLCKKIICVVIMRKWTIWIVYVAECGT